MSTVTAVRKGNQIAIACDTLIKWGNEKNSAKYVVNHNKIIQVKDSYIAVTGPAAGILALKHHFNNTKETFSFDTVDDIFMAFRDFQHQLKDFYHFETNEEETGFEPSTMYVLIVNPRGIFAVGSYRDVQEFERFYSYGSGNEFALGAMFHCYEEKSMTAEAIARAGIQAACEFDDATEAPVIVYTVEVAK
jgi:ATP-dependent protease HslVU (ClpYQ) peptidase subunit